MTVTSIGPFSGGLLSPLLHPVRVTAGRTTATASARTNSQRGKRFMIIVAGLTAQTFGAFSARLPGRRGKPGFYRSERDLSTLAGGVICHVALPSRDRARTNPGAQPRARRAAWGRCSVGQEPLTGRAGPCRRAETR